MEFKTLDVEQRNRLRDALRNNALTGQALHMSKKDTSFMDATGEVTDEEVITAIRSVPCHY